MTKQVAQTRAGKGAVGLHDLIGLACSARPALVLLHTHDPTSLLRSFTMGSDTPWQVFRTADLHQGKPTPYHGRLLMTALGVVGCTCCGTTGDRQVTNCVAHQLPQFHSPSIRRQPSVMSMHVKRLPRRQHRPPKPQIMSARCTTSVVPARLLRANNTKHYVRAQARAPPRSGAIVQRQRPRRHTAAALSFAMQPAGSKRTLHTDATELNLLAEACSSAAPPH